jgi:hypothetical protein
MMDQKSYIYEDQLDFIGRFQIKELFWDTRADSATNNFKEEMWNNLNNFYCTTFTALKYLLL